MMFTNSLIETINEGDSKHDYIQQIIHDLTNMLNVKKEANLCLNNYILLNRSLLNYGLPDLGNYCCSLKEDQKIVAKLIKQAINLFEPRLVDVEIEPIDHNTNQNIFYFKITANLFNNKQGKLLFFSEIDPKSEKVDLKIVNLNELEN